MLSYGPCTRARFSLFIQQAQRVVGLACISCRRPRLSPKSDTDLAPWIPTRQRSAVRDHDFAEMAAALEMAVHCLGLGKGECAVDHGAQAV
jgi:hypothetical protein